MLMVSHALNLLRHFADCVGVMEHGLLIKTTPSAELFDHPHEGYTHKLLASHPQRLVDAVD